MIAASWVVSPVVVGDRDKCAPDRAVPAPDQPAHWGHRTGQRRSNGPQEHMLGSASRDDEAADANIIAGLNSHPSREVEGLRRRSRRGGWGWGEWRCWGRCPGRCRCRRRCSCGCGGSYRSSCRRWRSGSGWCWRRCRRRRHGKGINLVVSGEVDASASRDAGIEAARAGHQFVRAAAGVNHGAGVTIVTVQALIAFGTDYPHDRRCWCHRWKSQRASRDRSG